VLLILKFPILEPRVLFYAFETHELGACVSVTRFRDVFSLNLSSSLFYAVRNGVKSNSTSMRGQPYASSERIGPARPRFGENSCMRRKIMKVLFWGKEFQRFFDTLSTMLVGHEIGIADPLDDKGALNDAEVLVIRPSRIDDELLSRAPSLRMVQQWGAGAEGIDVPACVRRGVIPCNVPSIGTGNAEGVAEVAFLHMLLHAKRFFRAQEKLMEGKVYTPPGTALWGKRGCVVGLGNVGRSVAVRMKAFGMSVTGVNRTPPSDLDELVDAYFPLDALEEAVRGCRFVVAALALNNETEGIFSGPFFRSMDRNAVFINVARGGLVERRALEQALAEGSISGAGLDVLWEEPHSTEDPLLAHPAVTVTPHIGGVNDAAFDGVLSFIVRNIELFSSGEIPLSRLDKSGAGASSCR